MENQNTNFLSSVQNAAPNQLDVQTTKNGGTQMNVVNAVNANGIVSGRKVVDFIWQRIGICAMIIAAGCMIAVIVMVIIANGYNISNIKTGFERDALKEKVDSMYKALKVDDQADAMAALSEEDVFDGQDLAQLMPLVIGKYGVDVEFDYTDTNKIFLRKNGVYKVISLVVKGKNGAEHFYAYSKTGKTNWKFALYDETADEPCAKSSAEEKGALKNLVTCPEED